MVVVHFLLEKKGGISNIFLEGRLLTTGNSCSILASSEEGGCRLPWVLIDYGIGMVMPVQIGETE